MSSPEIKIFCFTVIPIYGMNPPSQCRHEGRSRESSRKRGAGCDGRCGVRRVSFRRTKTPQRTAKSCGSGAATLASSGWSGPLRDGGKKGRSPGRARISRKAVARGRPGCLGCTCQTRVRFFTTHCTRCCGRSRRPAFPAPSVPERANEDAKLRRYCAVRILAVVPDKRA